MPLVFKSSNRDQSEEKGSPSGPFTVQEQQGHEETAAFLFARVQDTDQRQKGVPKIGVLTILPLLKERLSDPQDKYQVDAAITSAKFLNNYISNCLDFVSLEAEEFQLKNKKFNFNIFLQELLELIMMQANRKGLLLNLQKEESVPEFLNSDEQRIRQILITLLINAVKYTIKGTITLRVTKDPSVSNLLMFQVSDTGIGMPVEKQAELFKLFGGKPESAQNTIQRVGFGLTVSNMLCKQFGRELTVESEVNKGTTFTFGIKLEPIISPLERFKKTPHEKSKSYRNLLKFTTEGDLGKNTQTRGDRSSIPIRREEEKTEFEEEEVWEGEGSTKEFLKSNDIQRVITSGPKKLISSQNVIRKAQQLPPIQIQSKRQIAPEYKLESGKQRHHEDKSESPMLVKNKNHVHSPTAMRSREFGSFVKSGEKTAQICAVSFYPGKNMTLNKEFLKDHVWNFTKGKSRPKEEKKSGSRTFNKAMVDLNHPCQCPIILIVDDNEINKIALCGMLNRLGLIYREGSNGKEALQVLLEENSPKDCCRGIKLVLMDCDMPIMDGITASKRAQQLIQRGKICPTHIVAVSAYEGATMEQECFNAGMKEYLTKPVDIEKLFDCIKRYLA